MKSQDPYDEKTRRKIEAMVEAEERYLAALRREALESEVAPPRITSRRTLAMPEAFDPAHPRWYLCGRSRRFQATISV